MRAAVPDYSSQSLAAESVLETRFLPNLWLGVSVELQKWTPVRLDKLAATSAGAVRFASCEPLLGALDLRPWLGSGLDWVIVGGESRPGARPMHPDWARSLRDQCQAFDVPFFFKFLVQVGGPTPKAGGRQLDGRTWDGMPATPATSESG